MAKKEEYKIENELFLQNLRGQEGVYGLGGGVLYKVISSAGGSKRPTPRSVVTVHYRGTLIGGREFDNSRKRGCPEAFRVCELIGGFQRALLAMSVGDHWEVYIPFEEGYGKRGSGPIPGCSTLIFEIELLGIA